MTQLTEIRHFRDEWAFLSNFYRSDVEWRGIVWPTAEHAFQGSKTFNSAERLWICSARTPGEAKRRGRKATLRPRWNERIRFEVMAEVLFAKFTQQKELVSHLTILTGDAVLVEGNTWHDQLWGDCECGRSACETPGANHLGNLLMRLREQLRNY